MATQLLDSAITLPSVPLPATKAAGRLYLGHLDGMRALAALFVVLHHSWLQSWPYVVYPADRPHGLTAYLTGWLAFGHLAVTVFIAISGFCLTIPIVRGNGKMRTGYLQFVKRRATRILPPYYAALALSCVAAFFLIRHTHTLYDMSLPVTWDGFISHVLLVQNFAHNQYQINGPLWSIAVEFQIYLLFPLLVLLRRRISMWASLVLALVAGNGLYIWAASNGYGDRTPHFFGVFALGMLAADYAFRPDAEANPEWKRIALLAFCAALPAGAISHHFELKPVTDLAVGVISAAVLFLTTVNRGWFLTKALSSRPLVLLGTFSYSLYLIHFPLQQLLWQNVVLRFQLPKLAGFLFVGGLGTLIAIGIAYLFFYLFERPFLSESSVGKEKAEIATHSLPGPAFAAVRN